MNILYLIGNGFDLNAGISTRATDFYDYIPDLIKTDCSKEHIENLERIVVDINKSKLKDDQKWSNYERALGTISNDYTNINDYISTIRSLRYAFNRFIKKQEKCASELDLTYDNKNFLAHSLYTMCMDGVQRTLQPRISKLIENETDVSINFVTFNYTSLLDNCIEESKKVNPSISNNMGIVYSRHINPPLHIHGRKSDTDDPPIIGLDNVEQILNQSYQGNTKLINMLIKPTMNQNLRNNKMDQFKDLINRSDVIVIYGMSIGETDATWWRAITNWLESGNKNDMLLVINIHSSPNENIMTAPDELAEHLNSVRESILNFSELTEESIEYCKNNILISHKSKMFDLFNT